jgi:hypothetical protein
VRVIPLIDLGALAESIVIAPVKTANVRKPSGILKRAFGAQVKAFAPVAYEHLIRVVFVVVGKGQGTIEAAGRLAEMDAAVGFDKTDIGGWNDRGTIAASLRVEGAKCDTARRERLHCLAEQPTHSW